MDIDLARRLERAEGMANAAYVDARRRAQPEVGAQSIRVAGVYAMFDGISSPLTQTFGLGVFEPFLAPEFDEVEAFFGARGAPTAHEVSSFAARASRDLLETRGYKVVESSTVLVRPTQTPVDTSSAAVSVRVVDRDECRLWSQISAQGWSSESADLAAFVLDLASVISLADGVTCFVAEIDQQPVAAAALNISNDVALLAGASTIPSARRRGAQSALLEARLRFAAALGVDLAMVVTSPESASQRNAERQQFRPVYGRSKWQLGGGGAL